jgi:hypothetical protein
MAASQIKVESILNKDDDTLPYAYFHPETDGKLTWMCGEDAEGKITSVFCYDYGTHKDKKCQYLPNIEAAREIRKTLVGDTTPWQKLKAPEVTFTFPGEQNPRTLTRKEKRYLKKKVSQMQKKNPLGPPES